MPNWCNNLLTIESKEVKELLQSDGGLFESLVGKFPEKYLHDEKIVGLSDELIDGKYFNWYEHNISEYGTKWDVLISNIDIQVLGDDMSLSFETAWSPPLEFCRKLSEKFNTQVVIEFSEYGVGFGGRYIFDGGEQIESVDMSYMEWMYECGDIVNEIEFFLQDNSPEETKKYFSQYSFYDEQEFDEIISSLVS